VTLLLEEKNLSIQYNEVKLQQYESFVDGSTTSKFETFTEGGGNTRAELT
jgi:hypothetical protein